MKNHLDVGRWGEDLAVAILQTSGLQILERNWRPRTTEYEGAMRGEVDAVAIDTVQENLVFVEVKTRSTVNFGNPFEAITASKAQRLRALAYTWCREHPDYRFLPLRLDAVSICGNERSFTFEHLKAVS